MRTQKDLLTLPQIIQPDIWIFELAVQKAAKKETKKIATQHLQAHAQRAMQQGMEKGMQCGMAKRRQTVIQQLLSGGMKKAELAQMLRLSLQELEAFYPEAQMLAHHLNLSM